MTKNLDIITWAQQFSPVKVAIIRALPGLGDLLCCIPALRSLRAALPSAEITLIGLQADGFVRRFSHYFDRYLEFPGYPGIPEVAIVPSRIVTFLAEMQAQQFDLVLQMQGDGSTMNGFATLMGAKQCAGFFHPERYCPDPTVFMPYPGQEPEPRRHIHLMQFLGIPSQGEHLEFPLWQRDWEELEQVTQTHQLQQGAYICVHPGASTASRRWSYQNFAAVADSLAAQGLQVVLTGTTAETKLVEAVAEMMRFPTINLAGQTSLGTLAVLLKRSRLLICNDTGVSHLAAALQVNSVVIFSNSDLQRWAPLDRQRHRVVQCFASDRGRFSRWATSAVLHEALELLQLNQQPQEYDYAS
jgi:ADP-heptose:LPS heptosyltransferase